MRVVPWLIQYYAVAEPGDSPGARETLYQAVWLIGVTWTLSNRNWHVLPFCRVRHFNHICSRKRIQTFWIRRWVSVALAASNSVDQDILTYALMFNNMTFARLLEYIRRYSKYRFSVKCSYYIVNCHLFLTCVCAFFLSVACKQILPMCWSCMCRTFVFRNFIPKYRFWLPL